MRFLAPILLFVSLYTLPLVTHAALLYFDPTDAELHRGDTISVALRLDVDEGECINTIDGVINYDASVRAVDVSRGNSIFNIWIENPVIDETAHTVTFAGGIPGGYCGRIPGDPSLTNEVLRLVFRSPGFIIGAEPDSDVRVWLGDETQVLLHDGLGTNAAVQKQEAHITLLDQAGAVPQDSWREVVSADDQIPSDFLITLTRDEFAFNGDYFITFNAVDKQSGIDHYEVMEEPFSEFYTFRWGRADAPWTVTESPYVLKDQTLNSTIRVKVVDKAGNERIEVLVPDEAQRSISRDKMIALIFVAALAALIAGLAAYAIMMRKKRFGETEAPIHHE